MDSSINIFASSQDQVCLPPQMPSAKADQLHQVVTKHFRGSHFWLLSSGTESAKTGATKVVALSQKAMRAAAEGVARHFTFTSSDIFLNTLPLHHVSGLMQKARAEVCEAQFIDLSEERWDLGNFIHQLRTENATVTSLVPTQIFDIVSAKRNSPSSLHVAFVGGGALSEELYQQACALGWPLVRTYGMTETCAMLAFKNPLEKVYRRLPHITSWQSDKSQRLRFLSPSLLSGYLWVEEKSAKWQDPKVDGWYVSDDCGIIEKDTLQLLARETELVKIKGETVSLAKMNEKWQTWLSQRVGLPAASVILALPHERDGAQLVLASEAAIAEGTLQEFHKTVLPFERLQKVFVLRLPRTELGKVKTAELLSKLTAL